MSNTCKSGKPSAKEDTLREISQLVWETGSCAGGDLSPLGWVP